MTYAEHLLQWIFGRNPRQVCMVEGCGWRNTRTAHEFLLEFVDRSDTFYEFERWVVPGTVSFGICGGKGCWEGLRDDYPLIEFGYNHSGAGGFAEPWGISQGYFILGLERLLTALESEGR